MSGEWQMGISPIGGGPRVKGKDMRKNKSSISKARSYAEIGEFWDEHDLSDFWRKTKKVKFDVDVESGVSSDTLVNLWLDQKIKEQAS